LAVSCPTVMGMDGSSLRLGVAGISWGRRAPVLFIVQPKLEAK
jgi:hypothetical protein